MSARARRLAIFLPVLVTVLVTAAIGVLVVLQDQRQNDQVSRAEEAGNDYLLDVADFRASVAREVNGVKDADPAALSRIVEKAIKDPPMLRDAPAYGRERSEIYAEARATSRDLLKPYRRLGRELRRADVALDYIAAARKALGLRATDYVGFAPISTSAPIRQELIPAFVAARDELDRVKVPPGQAELAATVRGAVQYVIDQATVLADRLDGGQNFSFSYADRFQAAIEAVDGYATTVKGDVTEAITAVTDS